MSKAGGRVVAGYQHDIVQRGHNKRIVSADSSD